MTDIGLYIHIPYCVSRCRYCGFYSTTGAPTESYIDALLKEAAMRKKEIGERMASTVYLGGGTPSRLPVSFLARLLQGLAEIFPFATDAEITMEMNPSDMSAAYLSAARAIGVNRLSVGVQSFDDRLLAAIGRRHTAAEAKAAVRRAYRAGFSNISIDLMYELPGQSVRDFEKSLLRAAHLPITHISVYSLILEEGTPFARLAEKGKLPRPTEEESFAMYRAMERILPHYGFARYEISSFARNGAVSRHNRKYWKLDEYLGLGPAASSRIGHARTTNRPDLPSYLAALQKGERPPADIEPLTCKEEMEEYCFLHLRMREGIDKKEYATRYGEPIEAKYGAVICDLKGKGLLKETENRIFLTKRGVALGNTVFEAFLL